MPKGIVKNILYDLREWVEWFVAGWPETLVGRKLRSFYWSKKFNLATRPVIGKSSKLYGAKNSIFIGKNFACGEYVEINSSKSYGIYIGNDVLVARGVYFRAANHRFDRLDIPINQQGHMAKMVSIDQVNYSIVIEDDVWIGANVTILSGAKVGRGSVIAAGAIVTKNFPEYSIIAGNPAVVLKSRKSHIINDKISDESNA